ncbi:MAG: hypothetical protein IPJ03_08215 [Ignavibacteriales bacterium]|nr:hypothetical protein [Ignavibacteriales bacterium]
MIRKNKIIISIIATIIIIAISFFIWIISYSHTPEGQFELLIKNTKSQIEHLAKQRDLGVSRSEMKSWFKDYDDLYKEAYTFGIDFIYDNKDISPEVSAEAVSDKILAKKEYWLAKINK